MPNIQFFSNLFDIMQERKKTSQLSWLWLSAFIIVLDYLSKWWMTLWLDKTRIVSVFPCLNFILTHNFGAAFSFLGQASGWQRWVFSAISGIVSIYLIRLLYRGGLNNGVACAVSLILGGAIGNLYDRLSLGYVIDFIDFCLGYWHFATFNLADTAISIGAVLWIVSSYKHDKK
ncbi:signal peptidase II [Rickettsiella grylli]|uniref:Lipoprotein signal peptidase n=1 Tax=Rickettsiella grylli TaxID=59196 RepID=A8PKG4_9COXI|nr:signal peptidase II [Rickettsiella grylli]